MTEGPQPPRRSGTAAPAVRSAAETEAQVFRDLEAARAARHALEAAAAVVLEYPDRRSLMQRLRARLPLSAGSPADPDASGRRT